MRWFHSRRKDQGKRGQSVRSVFLVILWPLFEPCWGDGSTQGSGAKRATLSGRRAERYSPDSKTYLQICQVFKSRRCRVWNGKEDKKQKYFLPLPLPLLLLFCCYSYYYHHHHNSVTTISFFTMICSFVSPQIHYFLFHFFHQPPSATHSSQIYLFTMRPLGTPYLIYLCPN